MEYILLIIAVIPLAALDWFVFTYPLPAGYNTLPVYAVTVFVNFGLIGAILGALANAHHENSGFDESTWKEIPRPYEDR